MPLFGKKEVCPECGKNVRQPRDPGEFLCPDCGHPGPFASPDQKGAWEAKQSGLARYQEILGQIVAGGDIQTLTPQLNTAAAAGGLVDPDTRAYRVGALTNLATSATADDLLTPNESERLEALASTFALRWEDLPRELVSKISVSAINGGILPEVAQPHVLAKKGETVHLERSASLMREVAVRQYQGGYQGFSFPIGKTGVRYRVGGAKGHSVQVGTQLQVADTGILAVTNKRAVYLGTRKTVDMQYSKLDNITVYTDGIQFHMSNRVNAPLFTMQQGADIVAALVNAAAQKTHQS